MRINQSYSGNSNGTTEVLNRSPERKRTLFAASIAHATHDGMSDVIYILLPIWQSQFALSYVIAGLMRGLYSGVMASFQIQASHFAKRLGRKQLLVSGTALSGAAYLFAGQAGALIGLFIALMLGGLGASTQHPLASSLVAETNEHDKAASRSALSIYNFSGDIGKMLLPAAVGLALSWFSWQQCVDAIGLLGLGMAAVLAWLIPSSKTAPNPQIKDARRGTSSETVSAAALGSGFNALICTGVIDSATRMGFLTFLPGVSEFLCVRRFQKSADG